MVWTCNITATTAHHLILNRDKFVIRIGRKYIRLETILHAASRLYTKQDTGSPTPLFASLFLLDEALEERLERLGALLGVPLLVVDVVDEGDTEPEHGN